MMAMVGRLLVADEGRQPMVAEEDGGDVVDVGFEWEVVRRWCISGLRGLHYLLDKVVQAGMYRDLSLHTSGPLQDPTTATITTITITNGDEMWRVRTFRETIFPE
ncbi:hypothetical protein Tco_0421337 [Tanacetum coccineum]